MTNDIQQLAVAAQTYLDALHAGDTSRLGALFLPEASLFTSIDGDLATMAIADYIGMVGQRASPKAQGHPNKGLILAIDFSGPASAVVKVEVSVPPKQFVDFLAFLKIRDQWRIITKIYHLES